MIKRVISDVNIFWVVTHTTQSIHLICHYYDLHDPRLYLCQGMVANNCHLFYEYSLTVHMQKIVHVSVVGNHGRN